MEKDNAKKETSINDIHSYVLFAGIDKRNGKIHGHRVLLSRKQIEQIEDIVLSAPIKVLDEVQFELEE